MKVHNFFDEEVCHAAGSERVLEKNEMAVFRQPVNHYRNGVISPRFQQSRDEVKWTCSEMTSGISKDCRPTEVRVLDLLRWQISQFWTKL